MVALVLFFASIISVEDAARIKYSTQRFVYLDVGESHAFELNDGTKRSIILKAVEEHADTVMNLMRRAEVLVEIDGKPVELLCEPYVMPVEVHGLRIQADTTSGWMDLPKKVQLSLWDASDPIVDTALFVFPLAGYAMFSQGIQAYNEPVHLGDRDGDPAGQRFYHSYGLDLAGFEGRDLLTQTAQNGGGNFYNYRGARLLADGATGPAGCAGRTRRRTA